MEHPLLHTLTLLSIFLLLLLPWRLATTDPSPSCRSTCGSVQVKYPFGTGHGCGSPRFQPYVTCRSTITSSSSSPSSSDVTDDEEHDTLVLTTHTGSYPITSISYATSTITVAPPAMSTCSAMQPSRHNFGLDRPGPFGPGPSTFVLLACSAEATLGSPACDPASHLCASLYACPSVASLGLPVFPPTNTCCVYSPASLDRDDELDLSALSCRGFSSVVSLRDYATDPARWEYGVALSYNGGVLESSVVETRCRSCELSDGVCGYLTTSEENNIYSFLCVCKGGFNTTTDCFDGYGFAQVQDVFWAASISAAFSRPIVTTCEFLLLFITSSFVLWG